MKKIDKIILTLFSVLIFLQSILIISMILGWVNVGTVTRFIALALNEATASKIILGVAIVCLLCSIKCIFFDDTDKEIKNQGILMQNDNGKLLISKPTLENLVTSVIKEFDSIDDASVSVGLDVTNNVIINVNLVVSKNVVIKELTLNIQNKIKEVIKKTSDLEVKEVNVKIKNISIPKEEKNKE